MTKATGIDNVVQLSSYERALGRMVDIETGATQPDTAGLRDLVGDCFWACYKPEVTLKDPVPAGREFNATMLKWLQGSPAWESTRATTLAGIFPSAMSAGLLYQGLINDETIKEAMQKEKEAEKAAQAAEEAAKEAAAQKAAADATGDPALQQAAQNAAQKAAQAQAQAGQKKAAAQAQLEQTLGKKHADAVRGTILQQANEKTEKAVDMMTGWGLEPGTLTAGDSAKVLDTLKRLDQKNTGWIAKITELMGRVKGTALQAKAKQTHTSGVVYSDGFTSKLHNIFPSELALLRPDSNPLLRATQMASYADHGLIGLIEGTQSEKQGDMLIFCDESGSMRGLPVLRAKALSLGIGQAAKEGGQEYQIFSFGDRIFHGVNSSQGIPAHMEWAGKFADDSGTDFNAVIDAAIQYIENLPEGRRESCDVVVITDGGSSIRDEVAARFRELQKVLGTRLVGVLVQVQSNGLASVTDRVIHVTNDEEIAQVTEKMVEAMARENPS